MPTDDIDKSLHARIVGHLKNTSQATKIVKGVMLLGGSLVTGIAQFVDIDPSGIEGYQIAGILGSILVFLAALWTLVKEQDATEELRVALDAKAKADELNQQVTELFAIYGDVDRASHLLVASNMLRGYVEHICSVDYARSEDELISSMFSMAGRSISLAMGLSGNNEWTLCAYKAHPHPGGKDKLRLVDHARAIACDKSTAREWEEGVGVAGICYSTEREIVVPHLQSEGVGSLFNVGTRQRDYDALRYQSIVAVPIQVDNLPRPWGVVTATSDRDHHFEPDAPGIQFAEGARVLAGYIALAIAIKAKLAKPEQEA